MALLEIENLEVRRRASGQEELTVLRVPEFRLERGARIGLQGHSGAGKTTFLNVIAGLLTPSSGSVRLLDRDLVSMNEPERDLFRGRHVGYVFQAFHLLPALTALENVMLGGTFGMDDERVEAEELKDRSVSLLARVGLEKRAAHLPGMLSAGEQQRVAIARALLKKPELLLADEPTGSLDDKNAAAVVEMILELADAAGAAVLLASHDATVLGRFAQRADLADWNRA